MVISSRANVRAVDRSTDTAARQQRPVLDTDDSHGEDDTLPPLLCSANSHSLLVTSSGTLSPLTDDCGDGGRAEKRPSDCSRVEESGLSPSIDGRRHAQG